MYCDDVALVGFCFHKYFWMQYIRMLIKLKYFACTMQQVQKHGTASFKFIFRDLQCSCTMYAWRFFFGSFGRSFVQWTNTFCNSIVLHFRSFSASFCFPFHQVTTAACTFSCTLFASENIFRHIEIGKFLGIIRYSMRPKCLKMEIAHDVVFVGVFTEFTIFFFVESQLFF